tara:strand:+ start:1273 stop:2280 length:1008 start_codon:yes stop_codon:yes gene_type:complete
MEKSCPKNKQKFYCKICDYGCSKKSSFNKHLLTAKHKNGISPQKNGIKKLPSVFRCIFCNKNYKHRSGQYRHQKICKKRPSVLAKISHQLAIPQNYSFICECGKSYKHASSLSKHRKSCIYLQSLEEEPDSPDEIIPTNNVEKLLKNILDENKELKEQMKSLKLGNTYNNTTNNNNQKYTINMYLNDKCKNAMSLKDFVENIKLSLEDLEFTSHHGFVEGVSNIFLKNLNDMEVTERPIHCSDQKRLQFYVKKEDKWEKDKQNEEIDKSIKNISSKQIGTLVEWTSANPNYEHNPAKMEEYFQLVGKTMGVDCEKNIRKIKKIISENVKLDDTKN